MLATLAADPATAEEACLAIVNLAGNKDLKGVSKQQLQKALQAAVDKSKNARTKKKAEDMLKAVR
jgi:hypothetical protein